MAEELRPSGPHSSESQKAFDVFRPPGYQKPVQSGDSHQHLLNDVHEGECDQNITQCGGPNSALCGICPNPHKSIELQFSKNYLTTKYPSLVRIQKIQKFRKIYSPDPDSGNLRPNFFLSI